MAQVVIYIHEYTGYNACMHCEVATETIINALVSLAILVSKQPIMSHVHIICQYFRFTAVKKILNSQPCMFCFGCSYWLGQVIMTRPKRWFLAAAEDDDKALVIKNNDGLIKKPNAIRPLGKVITVSILCQA